MYRGLSSRAATESFSLIFVLANLHVFQFSMQKIFIGLSCLVKGAIQWQLHSSLQSTYQSEPKKMLRQVYAE